MINKDRAKSLLVIALIIGVCIFAAGVSGRIIMGKITYEISKTEYISNIDNSIPGLSEILNRGMGNLAIKLAVSLIKNDSTGFVNAIGEIVNSTGTLTGFSQISGFVPGLRAIAEMAFQETRNEVVKAAGVYMPLLQFTAYYRELMLIGGIIAAVSFVLLFLMGGKPANSKCIKIVIIIGIAWIVLLAVMTIVLISNVKGKIEGNSQTIQTPIPINLSDTVQNNAVEQEQKDTLYLEQQEQIETPNFEKPGQKTKMTIEDEDKALRHFTAAYNPEMIWDLLKSNEVVFTGINPSSDEERYREMVMPDYIGDYPVVGIEGGAFWNVSSLLTRIEIPNTVRIIERNPFYRCEKLSEIIISGDSEYIATIDGVLFSKYDKRLICYPCALPGKEYTIPMGIVLIGDDALAFCNNLRSVVIPDSVTSIGEKAFVACSSLKSINVPNSVTYIGEYAFDDCENVTITVSRNSYAEEYCRNNNLNYVVEDDNEWLISDSKSEDEGVSSIFGFDLSPDELKAKVNAVWSDALSWDKNHVPQSLDYFPVPTYLINYREGLKNISTSLEETAGNKAVWIANVESIFSDIDGEIISENNSGFVEAEGTDFSKIDEGIYKSDNSIEVSAINSIYHARRVNIGGDWSQLISVEFKLNNKECVGKKLSIMLQGPNNDRMQWLMPEDKNKLDVYVRLQNGEDFVLHYNLQTGELLEW